MLLSEDCYNQAMSTDQGELMSNLFCLLIIYHILGMGVAKGSAV